MYKFLIALLLISGNSFADSSITTIGKNEKVTQLMKELMIDYSLPSLSMAIAVDGEIVYANALGYADVKKNKLATIDTQYSVGSIAKSMTGVAVMKLVADGKLSLDDSIYNYLPNFTRYQHDISVKQLASHTAGIDHMTPARTEREFVAVRDHSSPYQALGIFAEQPLLFKPGSAFRYSSNGYILLSAVIESAANENYVSYMQENIFSRLNMVSTELDNSTAGKGNSGQYGEATYYKSYKNNDTYVLAEAKRDRSFLFGGGGYISTPSDLVKLGNVFIDANFLSKKERTVMATAIKIDNGDINPQGYAIGWRTKEMSELKLNNKMVKVIHHGGVMGDAATSFLLHLPEYKATVAFATNVEPDKYWQMRPIVGQTLLNFVTTK